MGRAASHCRPKLKGNRMIVIKGPGQPITLHPSHSCVCVCSHDSNVEISNSSTIFPRLKATSETERNLLVSKWHKEVRFPVCAEEKEAFDGWPTPLRQTREQQSESGSNSSSAQLLIQLLSRRRVTRIRQLSNQQEATGFIGGRGGKRWGEVEGEGGR